MTILGGGLSMRLCAYALMDSYLCIVSQAGNLTQLIGAVSDGQEILTFLNGDN